MSKIIKVVVVICVFFLGAVSVTQYSSLGTRSATLLFVGDMNFDRQIRKVISEKGEDFVFSCLEDALQAADLVVGNLEGPITDKPSVSLGSEVGSPANYVFTFPSTTGELLKRQNIKLVNIGNNHIDDFGNPGFVSTKEYLEKSGISYMGGMGGQESIYRTDLGGSKISFVSYNQFGGDSRETVADKISKEVKDGRMVIVYTHWGDEYSPVTSHQRSTAKIFSDAGARVIIGSHPHVISSSEKIGNTIVYYSLGNFIFDQYWNSEVSTGLTVELSIENGEIEILEREVVMGRDGRTCPFDIMNR